MAEDYNVTGFSGKEWKQSELQASFNLVTPEGNWKNTIDAFVGLEHDLNLLADAIVHFTGSLPVFTVQLNGKVRVRAAGYFATIGA